MRVLHVLVRWLRAVPLPALNDLYEWAGVLLVAVALSYVHVALAVGVVGLYLIVIANILAAKRQDR